MKGTLLPAFLWFPLRPGMSMRYKTQTGRKNGCLESRTKVKNRPCTASKNGQTFIMDFKLNCDSGLTLNPCSKSLFCCWFIVLIRTALMWYNCCSQSNVWELNLNYFQFITMTGFLIRDWWGTRICVWIPPYWSWLLYTVLWPDQTVKM